MPRMRGIGEKHEDRGGGQTVVLVAHCQWGWTVLLRQWRPGGFRELSYSLAKCMEQIDRGGLSRRTIKTRIFFLREPPQSSAPPR